MSDIKFGTDGWRGRIAEDYTFDNVRRAAQGFATYLLERGAAEKGAVIGHDQRFSGDLFARAAAEVLAGNGITVWLTDGPTPTPVIAHAIVEKGVAGGINVTASHNPPADNGFKIRDASGGAVDPDGIKEVEAGIPASVEGVKQMRYADALEQGMIKPFDATPAYIEHLHDLLDLEAIKDCGYHILVDPMWGNGIGWLERLIGGGATTIDAIHNHRNPAFPDMSRPEPIPPNIDTGLHLMQDNDADVLIIFDGDADRVGAGDENGEFINQLQMFALLALYFLEERGERGPLVKTISTTNMLKKLGEMYDIPVHETGVGFKYVAPKMIEVDAMIGGEESGGFAFQNHVPERDGILAGLYLLDFMRRKEMKPSELIEHLYETLGDRYYYGRIDTPLPSNEFKEQTRAKLDEIQPDEIAGLKVTDKITIDGYKFALEDGGWLLIRFSGTEPLIRVYCETTHADKVDDILADGQRIAGIE